MRGPLCLSATLLTVVAGCAPEYPPDPPAKSKPPAAAAAPGAVAGAPGQVALAAPAIDPAKEKQLAEVRQRQLSNDDFSESDRNRDPFRSFLSSFGEQVVVKKQHAIVLEKFSLDELKLVAIVGGNSTPAKAMLVDPSGNGQTIKRGDHVSKADALLTRIDTDKSKLYFQIDEDAGGGKVRPLERIKDLHEGETVAQ